MPRPRHKDSQPDWIDDLYTHLADEEDARVCKAISDKACREVPPNFFLHLVSNSLTKIGDRVASPKTTLAWILQAVGAPVFFTGIIVPLREAGSLLPQLLIAGWIRQLPVRKWIWVGGSAAQALSVALLGLVALTLSGAAAGWAVVGLLAAFSLARGFCSIASKDVLGKTIPKTRRGRLKGLMGSVSGTVTLFAGAGMIATALAGRAEAGSTFIYAAYLFGTALLWSLAAAVYAALREFPGETEGGGNALSEALRQLRLLRDDPPFRRFVFVRALAMGSGLGAPFVVSLAHREVGQSALWLGLFLLMDGLAGMLAAPLLGKRADRNSRDLLRFSMAGMAALFLALVLLVAAAPTEPLLRIAFPAAFFLLGILHSGVRLGRKTYLVDLAEGNKRTAYVAVSNTLIGVLLLAAGAVTGLVAVLSVSATLVLLAAAGLLGAGLGRGLPKP
jgi:hypothetical protein